MNNETPTPLPSALIDVTAKYKNHVFQFVGLAPLTPAPPPVPPVIPPDDIGSPA